jgi:uncharacterized protein (TIGR02271 family)
MDHTKNSDNSRLGQVSAHSQAKPGAADKTIAESASIPRIEEQASISKEWVETGKVHISKKITEHEESINVQLMHEKAHIERVPVNQYVDAAPPAVRYEGDTMIIPVLKEVLVTEKRLILVEELRVTMEQVQTEESKQVTLRKEEINIRKDDNRTTQP